MGHGSRSNDGARTWSDSALLAFAEGMMVRNRPIALTGGGTLPGGTWAEMWDINDAGDIVGAGNDADWNWRAARWSAKDPNFVQVLGFPGDWSTAFRVNSQGIAVGGYGFGDGPERAVAIKFR